MRALIIALRIRALEALADGQRKCLALGVGRPTALATTLLRITNLKAEYRRVRRGSGLQSLEAL